MTRFAYLLAYTIPISVLASYQMPGAGAYFALLYAFGLLPFLEFFLPAPTANPSAEDEAQMRSSRYYDWILYSMVPIQYALIWGFGEAFTAAAGDEVRQAGLVTALGVSCGVLGINVAHELGHRAGKPERVLARLLLATSLNWQFYLEHNRGHHKNVSTPDDPESARLNETLYAFWVRSVRDSFRNAWRLDSTELSRGLAFELALTGGVWFFFGAGAAFGFVLAALFGILLLQSVNYIEHYGLARAETASGRFEPVRPVHSWNANPFLSRAILFELSRHSDHHAYASRKYPILRHHDESPQMPTGYPGMILLALVPPLWKKIIHPRLAALKR